MLKFTSLKSTALVSVTAVATTLLIQACGGSAVAQSASDADIVEGVWDSTITSKDCTSGAVLGQPFKGLVVFRRGGTMDVDNAQGRSTRGNIYGTWKHGAGTSYAGNAVHHRFNADGTFAGINKVQRALTLSADGNSFTGTIAVQILDPAGTVISQVCPTESAVRMIL